VYLLSFSESLFREGEIEDKEIEEREMMSNADMAWKKRPALKSQRTKGKKSWADRVNKSEIGPPSPLFQAQVLLGLLRTPTRPNTKPNPIGPPMNPKPN
jgi:hypothetical protein